MRTSCYGEIAPGQGSQTQKGVVMDSMDALLNALRSQDGRRMTGRELAVALGLDERDVRVLLSEARRRGEVKTMGSSPTGATLYIAAGPQSSERPEPI